MRILLAPDSFKGSISATRFCEIGQALIHHFRPDIEVISRPLSDGGEGFIDAIIASGLAQRQTVATQDPLGRAIRADFAWQPTKQTAYIEMAQASGLPLLTTLERNPLITSTYGTGLVIQAALELGAQTLVLGLGGSATNDGGAGALQALGIPLLDKDNQPVAAGGAGLNQLSHIGEIPVHLQQIDWQLACDVNNPLLGPRGATAIYGPQKGATTQTQPILEAGLANFALQIQHKTGWDITTSPGSGAAGGMATGFMSLLNAQMHSGFDLLRQAIGLEQIFNEKIDLVITGEGKLDTQSLQGKLPIRVAQLAKKHHATTIAICGQIDPSLKTSDDFASVYCLMQAGMSEQTAISQTETLLTQKLAEVWRDYML